MKTHKTEFIAATPKVLNTTDHFIKFKVSINPTFVLNIKLNIIKNGMKILVNTMKKMIN